MIARIHFKVPDGANQHDVAEFIADALSWAGGCRHPDDPMFGSLKLDRLIVHGVEYDVREE